VAISRGEAGSAERGAAPVAAVDDAWRRNGERDANAPVSERRTVDGRGLAAGDPEGALESSADSGSGAAAGAVETIEGGTLTSER
jgi:hypothetical protein